MCSSEEPRPSASGRRTPGPASGCFPPGAPIEVGVEVVLCFRLVALHVVAACRIVRAVDEAARFGFAYGTLPMHPETGEEAFLVEWDEERDPSVRFSITAFSRPRERLAALAGPVSRRVQRRVTESYLEGVRRFVST